MPIAFWLRHTAIVFGLLYFATNLFLAVWGVHTSTTRNDRLEKAGAIVPGLAGLMIAAAFLIPRSILSPVLCVMSIPTMVLGRAVYELVVFRKKSADRDITS